MGWPFKTRMAAVNNAVEGAKFQEKKRKEAENDGNETKEKRHRDYREHTFKGAEQHLGKAREETNEAIKQRDSDGIPSAEEGSRKGWFW
ncbi:MAG: hypothetical protein AAF215_27900 [Cyanobacteria bacterium P01_A01_bin.123]